MIFIDQSLWQTPQTAQLALVLASLKDEPSIQAFLSDVMTKKEIIEISARLEAAKMLAQGATYDEITRVTKLSSRTIARISDWLQNGAGGYRAALDIVDHSDHILPARAA
jgi:TrpR-related protein YerC/YecD